MVPISNSSTSTSTVAIFSTVSTEAFNAGVTSTVKLIVCSVGGIKAAPLLSTREISTVYSPFGRFGNTSSVSPPLTKIESAPSTE